ncbi:hypothetical protein MRB53_041707 [Persea americana]|nr:hypothetical protein MRB53_041707 [Persea americana]
MVHWCLVSIEFSSWKIFTKRDAEETKSSVEIASLVRSVNCRHVLRRPRFSLGAVGTEVTDKILLLKIHAQAGILCDRYVLHLLPSAELFFGNTFECHDCFARSLPIKLCDMISSGATRRISDGATHHNRHSVDVHNDAFFELNQAELNQSVSKTFSTDSSAASGSDDGASIHHRRMPMLQCIETVLTFNKLVLTPLNMLSLLLSLLFVDQQREEKKQEQLKQNRNWSDYVRWSKESEPYQAQRDATWQPDQSKKNFDWVCQA